MVRMPLPDYARSGPASAALKARLIPSNGATRILLSGHRAAARFMLARDIAGARHDALTKTTNYRLDTAMTRPWPAGGDEALGYLAVAGLELDFDEGAAGELADKMTVVQARMSRWLPDEDDAGELIGWRYDAGTVDPAAIESVGAVLTDLGWDNTEHLFRFSFHDACEIATKRDMLIATPMGTGKSRLALAIDDYHRHHDNKHSPTIILALKRHLTPWEEELGGVAGVVPCTLLTDRYGACCYEKWTERGQALNFDQPYLLLSLERLRLLNPDEMGRLQALASRSRVIVDEGYVAANRNAKLTKSLWKLSAMHHTMLSGTPIRGFIDKLLPLLQWVHRGGSVALPDYPIEMEGSQRRWDAKHKTFAVDSNGGRKAVAFIRNQDELTDLLAPLMKRRLRNEPEIVQVLGEARIIPEHIIVPLDDQHIENYRAVLDQFIEWYKRERIKKGKYGGLTTNEILVKLGYLVWNVPAPWRMEDHSDDDFDFPAYERGPTAIHRAAVEIAGREAEEGHVSIIAGISTEALEMLHEQALAAGLKSALIYGGVGEDRRREIMAAGRRGELDVMVASAKIIAEGLNLSWANRMIVTEYFWDSATLDQLLARITRGVQVDVPKAYLLIGEGTIQQYMIEISGLKRSGAAAALDRAPQDEDAQVPDIQQYANSLVGVDGYD